MALALGRTVAELEEELSARELKEWMAFYSIEPWGEYRADVRSAMVSMLLYGANKGRNAPKLTIKDFMPFAEKEEVSQADQVKRTREKIEIMSKLSKGRKRRADR